MRIVGFLVAALSMVSVISCGQPSTKKSGDAEKELKKKRMAEFVEDLSRTIEADSSLIELEIPKETVDSVNYLLGVNYGLMLKGQNFFDEVSQIEDRQLMKGMADAFEAGQPANPYIQDSLWAEKFKVNPYEMNSLFNSYLSNREALGEDFIKENKETVDSVSYLLGVNYGVMLEGQGFFDEISQVNKNELMKGMADVFEAGMPERNSDDPYAPDTAWAENFRISPYEMNLLFNSYLSSRDAYKARLNELLGEKFLEENLKKDGVKETESGLQYILHAEGEGDKVGPMDTVVVNYVGNLIDGTEFDANNDVEFIANRVIKGWTEGLGLMGKGGKATLFIPGNLAYGERGVGSEIGPNSVLVFEVEVLDIKRNTNN